ncbi:MAG: primosomal protein N' [Chloroflexi bacterium]|nr:MAG: primosomal protein N' [Chloroflexota bacterium]
MSELFADVAVRAQLFSNPASIFTYHVPAQLRSTVVEGALVWVPFGRQRVQGIVLALYTSLPPHIQRTPEQQPSGPASLADDPQLPTIRPIIELSEAGITIPPHLLRLARWLHGYYRARLWDALELLLPPGAEQEAEVAWRATPHGMHVELGTLPASERGVLYYLRRNGETSEKVLHDALHGSPSELRRLCLALKERGLLTRATALSRPKARTQHERMVRLLVPPADLPNAISELGRATKRIAVLQSIAERVAVAAPSNGPGAGPLVSARDLPLMTLRELAERDYVELSAREVVRNPLDGAAIKPDVPPELSPLQARVLAPITDAVQQREHAVFLLHGVTGSGKTELYLRAIARTLRQGRQALVLVPEIALTAQLVRRFAARFGEQVVVLHSGLSLGERFDTWRRLRRAEARVVVGSRSAVFAPLPELGLIVVDEEHEPSYKHEEGVRYHARDVALELAALTESVVILGSATPAIESYQRAREGAYALLELPERVGRKANGASQPIPLPPVRIVDMRLELQHGNRSIFSRPLQRALTEVLRKRQQALLFLNRRGTAAFVMCRDCGYVVGCPRCSSPLTVHIVGDEPIQGVRSPGYELLRCHTCGHRELAPSVCRECWSSRIRHFGIGTQRVVAAVEELWPEARVLRWDRDVTGRKGAHDRLLQSFLNHEADIVVGTQMIAKGLDLPLVTLVGVVSADTGLHLPDFRAGERAFQLMAQVAGRAGRRDLGGEVIMQSYTPDHYALQAAAAHDYHSFFQEEIAFRADTHYPPFSQLVRFLTSGPNADTVRLAAEALAERVRVALGRLSFTDAAVIGPAPAFMERMRGKYRWHLLVRAPDIHPLLDELGPLPGWTVDVDPGSML